MAGYITKPGIGRDRRAEKLKHQAAVEIEPQSAPIRFTLFDNYVAHVTVGNRAWTAVVSRAQRTAVGSGLPTQRGAAMVKHFKSNAPPLAAPDQAHFMACCRDQ